MNFYKFFYKFLSVKTSHKIPHFYIFNQIICIFLLYMIKHSRIIKSHLNFVLFTFSFNLLNLIYNKVNFFILISTNIYITRPYYATNHNTKKRCGLLHIFKLYVKNIILYQIFYLLHHLTQE